ncbi:unnamed protein product [Camellia sinensis]
MQQALLLHPPLHPPLRPLPQHLRLRLLPPLCHRRRPPHRPDLRSGLITDLAAATTCYVATHLRLENVSGKYLANCNEASTSKLGSNSTEAARLWSVLELMPQEFLKILWIQPREI